MEGEKLAPSDRWYISKRTIEKYSFIWYCSVFDAGHTALYIQQQKYRRRTFWASNTLREKINWCLYLFLRIVFNGFNRFIRIFSFIWSGGWGQKRGGGEGSPERPLLSIHSTFSKRVLQWKILIELKPHRIFGNKPEKLNWSNIILHILNPDLGLHADWKLRK